MQVLMAYVIMPSSGTPPVPSEVIGQWQAGTQKEMNGFPANYSVTYSFSAPPFRMIPAGEFKIQEILSIDNGKCSMTRTTNESGWVVVHRSEEHTSELQSPCNLVCRLLLEKKK